MTTPASPSHDSGFGECRTVCGVVGGGPTGVALDLFGVGGGSSRLGGSGLVRARAHLPPS